MEKIKELYDQFQQIIASYEGQQTNWEKKYQELERLYQKIRKYRPQASKNAIFYEWVQRKLKDEVLEEAHRVGRKALRG